MFLSRRSFSFALLAFVASPALANPGKHRHPHRRRRRVRRRVRRRRIRRRTRWRVVRGRRRLVVPTTLLVGWELLLDDRVVVVKEIHEGRIVVEHPAGSIESIAIVKEDNDENAEDLEGSEYEVEIEVEEDED